MFVNGAVDQRRKRTTRFLGEDLNLMTKQVLKELGFVRGQNARAPENEIEVINSSSGKAVMMIMGGA
ncbi:hypothetical protein Syun_009836 [Stephania yunnanensis]|uniref:Uncharacterized protein n=1 Tax=Stephania yunnanensis TaxID=152371 RepID=A0AAP0KFD7_9MAGN